jgi:Fe-S-cluster containining protein
MNTTRARIALRILGEEVHGEAEAPSSAGRLDELLPLLWELDEAAIGVAVRKNPSQKRVSCAKGCSACCRAQPVPVTPPEAYALWKLVEALPEPKRRGVRQRFRENAERLEQNGMKAFFLREKAAESREAARAAVERYFALGLVCPFLEKDACGIHPVRPFVCRQYLVTSSPELCNDPLHQPVEVVPIPIRPAHAMLQVTEKFLQAPAATVPLVLALEFVEQHRQELEKRVPMKEAVQSWLGALTAAALD